MTDRGSRYNSRYTRVRDVVCGLNGRFTSRFMGRSCGARPAPPAETRGFDAAATSGPGPRPAIARELVKGGRPDTCNGRQVSRFYGIMLARSPVTSLVE